LDGRRTHPADVVLLNKRPHDREGILLITIREGRNRQVRRMLEAVGHPVRKLRRTRIGPLSDRHLRPGEWRDLSAKEVAALQSAAPAAMDARTGTRRRGAEKSTRKTPRLSGSAARDRRR
jgi:23S rRNA pseudouridine2605 synthase